MIQVDLSDEMLDRLRQLRRQALKPSERDRVEMVLLNHSGWTAPKIAEFFGCSVLWARQVLKRFAQEGERSLFLKRTGPPPNMARRKRIEDALRRRLAQPRAWSSEQLAQALRADGIELKARRIRQVLRRMRGRYRRTRPSLRHRQDQEARARARRSLRRYRRLAANERIRLMFLDECGFSPSQPTGRSWFLPDQDREVPYESPQGKRATAIALYEPYARRRRLRAHVVGRRVTTEAVVHTIRTYAARSRRRTVVVMDNAAIHTSRKAKAQFRKLKRRGVYVRHLPAYSPDLSPIEGQFRIIKHERLHERTYFDQATLMAAVRRDFRARDREIAAQRRSTKSIPGA